MIGLLDLPSRRKGIGANKYTAYTFVTDTHKRCSWCEEIKEHAAFHNDKRNIHCKGKAYYCKECANHKARVFHAEHRANNPVRKRMAKNRYVQKTFGITLAQYEQKLEQQNFKCAICDIELRQGKAFCHLDHNHATGQIRSFLCTNCNRGLGHFKEKEELLMQASMYLKHHKELDYILKEGCGL